MRIVSAVTLIAGVLCFSAQADVAVTSIAAVEVTKKCSDSTKGNLDDSWVRYEGLFRGSLASGLTGLVHLRLQPKMSAGGVKGIDMQPRQIYFKLPVSILEIMGGRWYDIYGPGYSYFGRYLYGVGAFGNGSMNTNYTILDGLKLTLNINAIKSALQVGVLPQDLKCEDAYVMAMFGGSPIEQIKFNIGGNFEAITPDGKDPVHRFMVNCGYTILKDLGLGFFGEMAIINLSEAVDNMWFLAGFTTKALPVLDKIQLELEIKNHRAGDPTIDNNLAWMLLLQRKVLGLTLDLNVGADPTVLGSKKIGDVGAVFRATAAF